MAKGCLLDRVKAGIVLNRCGITPWCEKLPADVRSELHAVRHWFRGEGRQKKIPIKAVARSIVQQLQAQKIKCPSTQTVEVWLRKND